MVLKNESPTNSRVIKIQKKDTQTKRLWLALQDTPKTRRELEFETAVHNNAIDWTVNKWMKEGRVFIARYGKCPITKSNNVQFITANEDYLPKHRPVQLTIFDLI